MLICNDHEPARKPDDVHVGDAGADLDVALILAARFHLQPHIAKLVVGLAGLGGGDDRATASGGRTK
jgi:hypothetical protein